MEKMLKQDEIDALFQTARPKLEDPPEAQENSPAVVRYNFGRAGQISNEQLRAISTLNDLFARNLTHNLSAWLRCRFHVNLVSAEQIPFNEFLMRIPEISYLSSVRLEPLGALSVLQLDLALAPPIIDLLLGGEGKEGPLRELTDIEEAILASVVEIICRELTMAWQSVGLSFAFERRQMQTEIARIMSVNEKTLCLSFEIRMSQGSGLLNLAFPAVVANTILRRLTTDWGRRRLHGNEARTRLETAAHQIRLGGCLQLPPVRVVAREIEALRPGQILRLGLSGATPAELRVGGQCIAQAEAVRQGAHRAARLHNRSKVGCI